MIDNLTLSELKYNFGHYSNALIAAIDNPNTDNLNEMMMFLSKVVTVLYRDDEHFDILLPNKLAAHLSEAYKQCAYKVGDKVHIKEECPMHFEDEGKTKIIEDDCTIVDVAYVFDATTFKPVNAYIVRLSDGNNRKLRSIDSIQYKIED